MNGLHLLVNTRWLRGLGLFKGNSELDFKVSQKAFDVIVNTFWCGMFRQFDSVHLPICAML